MEKFWTIALKATGPVAVIGAILWFTLQQFFSIEILSLFSSQQRFTIVLTIFCILMIILYTSIRAHYLKSTKNKNSSEKLSSVANISDSNIGGDFVMGDKIEKSDKDL